MTPLIDTFSGTKSGKFSFLDLRERNRDLGKIDVLSAPLSIVQIILTGFFASRKEIRTFGQFEKLCSLLGVLATPNEPTDFDLWSSRSPILTSFEISHFPTEITRKIF